MVVVQEFLATFLASMMKLYRALNFVYMEVRPLPLSSHPHTCTSLPPPPPSAPTPHLLPTNSRPLPALSR